MDTYKDTHGGGGFTPINSLKFGEGAIDPSKAAVGNEIAGAFQTFVNTLKNVKPVAGYEALWNDGVNGIPALYSQLFMAATGKPLV
jgi:hypothetical protein